AGVGDLVGVPAADGVRPRLVEQALVGGLHLGGEESVVAPALGGIDVLIRRHDVEIPGDDDGRVKTNQTRQVGMQTIEPAQLEIELRTRSGVAVRQIEAGDKHAVHGRLNVSALYVDGVAWQAASGLVNLTDPAQQRDAVPSALTLPYHVITKIADGALGKFFLRGFQFLQADDVRLS